MAGKSGVAVKPASLHQERMAKEKLLSHYQGWRGVRHQYGGNSRSGIDCSAYTQRALGETFNIRIPRTSKQQRLTGKVVPLKNARVGDLLFFTPRLFSGHVGIYLGDNTFIHVSSSNGVSRSRIDQGYWRKHFHSARRVLTH